MTDLEFTFTKICRRRNVTMTKVESVAFSMRFDFGLANLTVVLPAVANTFYLVKDLCFVVNVVFVTAPPILRFTNLGGATPGDFDAKLYMTAGQGHPLVYFTSIECDSCLYVVNGNTAGSFVAAANVYKITTLA